MIPTYIVCYVNEHGGYMNTKNKMHAMVAMLFIAVFIATSTLGGVQCVFARVIEFKIDLGENKKTSSTTSNVKISTVTSTKNGSIAGISYDKLVMANVSEAVNIRDDASEKAKLIGKLYKDCGGSIIERKSGWTKLQTGSVTGWVKDDYLLFGDSAVKLAETVVERTAVSTTSTLRVRKSPNTDSQILTLLAVGDKMEAISTEGDWVKVQFSDGEEAYVSAEFVKIEDSIDAGESIEDITKREVAEKKEKEAAKAAANKASGAQVAASGVATNNGAIAGEVNDTLLLAALIQAEGGNQPYEGQVSVGTVVMNRLRSGKYGSSVYSVIYAKGQFGPARSGQVANIYAKGPKASCIQAATDAMNGVSYIGGATHFRNVNSGYPGIVIGSHVFW